MLRQSGITQNLSEVLEVDLTNPLFVHKSTPFLHIVKDVFVQSESSGKEQFFPV